MFHTPPRRIIVVALLAIVSMSSRWAWSASHDGKGDRSGPKRILIIRHAEKPDEKGDPNLAPRGYQRADALAKVIPDHFTKPDFLFATKASAGSNRPVETITPLAKALDETIDTDFKDEQVAELAHAVLTDPKYDGKTVLIAWHHGKIPALAMALGVTNAPETWDAKVFDRVWEIKFEDGKAKFKSLPQHVLPGDSAE